MGVLPCSLFLSNVDMTKHTLLKSEEDDIAKWQRRLYIMRVLLRNRHTQTTKSIIARGSAESYSPGIPGTPCLVIEANGKDG